MARKYGRRTVGILCKALLFFLSLGALSIAYALQTYYDGILETSVLNREQGIPTFYEVHAVRDDQETSLAFRQADERDLFYAKLPHRKAVGREVLVCYQTRQNPLVCRVCSVGPHTGDDYWNRFRPEPADLERRAVGIVLSPAAWTGLGIPEDVKKPQVMWRFSNAYGETCSNR